MPDLDPSAIRTYRERHGLSLARLASLIGISESGLCRWEHGRVRGTRQNRRRLFAVMAGPPPAEPARAPARPRSRARPVRPASAARSSAPASAPPPAPTPSEVRAWRAQLRLTLAELGDLVGVSALMVGRWERGAGPITQEHAPALRRLLALRPPPRPGARGVREPVQRTEVRPIAADEIRAWRSRYAVSLRALARLVGAGAPTVRRWERGSAPAPSNARRLAEVLSGPPPGVTPPAGPPLETRTRRLRARRTWEQVEPGEIMRWRQARGISRETLASLLRVTPPTLDRWERGEAVPTAAMQRRVETVLADRPLKDVEAYGRVRPIPGHRITAWRERHQWSRRRLAAALGVSEGAVAAWEYGQTHPRRATLVLLRGLFAGHPLEDEPTCWELLSSEQFHAWCRAHRGFAYVAHELNVSEAAVRSWATGLCAPPLEVQGRLRELIARRPSGRGATGSRARAARPAR